MPAYVVVDVNVKDAKKYEDYKQAAQESVVQHGGRYVARGTGMEPLEGAWAPKRLVILEFPDVAAAKTWYRSPEYTAARKHRAGGVADFSAWIVDGYALP